jgi:zinc transporter ZupT
MVAIPIIFVIVGLSALLPWLLAKSPRARVVMALAVCLSAGAMLGIGMLHALPEATEVWEEHDGGHDHAHVEEGHADEEGHSYRRRAAHSNAAAAEAAIAAARARVAELLIGNAFPSADATEAVLAALTLPQQQDSHEYEIQYHKSTRRRRHRGSSLYALPAPTVQPVSAPTSSAGARRTRRHSSPLLRTLDGTEDPGTEDPGHDEHTGEEEAEASAEHDHGVAYPEMVACLTLLFLYSLEHIILRYLVKRNAGHLAHCDHGHGGHDNDHAHAHGGHDHLHSGSGSSGNANPAGSTNGAEEGVEMSPIASAAALSPPPELVASSSGHVPVEGAMAASGPYSPLAINGDVESPRNNNNNSAIVDADAAADADVRADLTPDHAAEGDDPVQKARAESVRVAADAFVATLAITIHCIMNGLALGAHSSGSASFWAFFGATVGHKFVDGFAAGTTIWRGKLGRIMTAVVVFTVAFATPLGIIIGYSVSRVEGSLARAVIMSISCGSFIFVAVFELMPAGFANKKYLWWKVFMLFLGFAIVTVIAKWA